MIRRILAALLLIPAGLLAATLSTVTITNPDALKIGITDPGTFKVTVTNAKPPALTVTAPATEVVNVVTPGQQGPAGSGSGGGGTWGTITGTLSDQTDLKSALDGKQATGSYVTTTDPRLTDARIPIAHVSTHFSAGSDPLTPANIGAANAAHGHVISDTTGLQTALDGKQPAGDYATNGRLNNYTTHVAATYEHKGTASGLLSIYSGHRQPEINARKVFHGIQTAGTPTWTANVFTLPTTGGNITYWHNGNKYSGSSNLTLALTPTANTLYYIYFDAANGQLVSSTGVWDIATVVPVATLIHNGTAASVGHELHNYNRSLDWHKWAHLSVGTRYISGLNLSGIGGSGTGVTWSISGGTIMDEDLTHNITAQTQANGARNFRQTSASAITFTDTSYPFFWNAGTSRVQYCDTGYAMQDLGNSTNYINVFVYATSDTTKPIWFLTPPIAAPYTTVANARAASPPSLSGLAINPEMKLLWRMIVSGGASPAIQAVTTADDYRTSSTLPSGGTTTPTASSVTYTPTAPDTAANVQSALDARPLTSSLAAVATSGSYPDLFNRPTIPAACVDIFDGAPGTTGATGTAIFCNVSGGIRSHTYDANGVNPSPSPVPFVVQLWHGATRVVASAWQWWTGGSSHRIYGSGTSSTFTPSLKSAFSNVSSNNYVAVQAKYSSAATGRRYCVTGTPIAVSKIGAKGDQGASATVDFASVQTALGSANDGTITLLSSTSSEHTRFQVKNSGSYVVFGITDRGLITVTTPDGTRLWSFTPAGSQMTLKTGSGRTIFSVISSAAGGTMTL